MAVKILIADDHPLMREGLKKVLNSEPDFTVVAESASAPEIFAQLGSKVIDIVLLDISLPGRSGLDIIKDIKVLYPDLPVLIVSMHPEDSFALRSLKLGASGYLTKDSASDDLVSAVRKLISGGVYLSAKLSKILVTQVSGKDNKHLHEKLSDREFQVLRLIASGKTVTQIAGELNLSIATVSTYRSRILVKMNLSSSAELTYYVISNNLGSKN